MNKSAVALGLLVAFLAASTFPPVSTVVHSILAKHTPAIRANQVLNIMQGRVNHMMLTTALKIGLFEHLAKTGPVTVGEAAAALQVNPRALGVLCENLAVIHLLDTNQNKISNSPVATSHLLADAPDSMVDVLRLFSTPHMTASIENMPYIVEHGKLPAGAQHAESPELQFWVQFADLTGHMASDGGKSLVQFVASRNISLTGDWLDTAAGSGEYGAAILEASRAGATVTFFDYPHVVKRTEEHVLARHPASKDHAKFVGGDLFKYSFAENSYNVVLAMNIFHHFSFDVAVQLAKIYFAATKSGGHVVVSEFLRDDTEFPTWRELSSFARFFNMVMLLTTEEGEAFSHSRMVAILNQAGFVDVQIQGMFSKPGAFISGRKPYQSPFVPMPEEGITSRV